MKILIALTMLCLAACGQAPTAYNNVTDEQFLDIQIEHAMDAEAESYTHG